MLFSGYLDLSFWELVAAALILTHITIASVTIFLNWAIELALKAESECNRPSTIWSVQPTRNYPTRFGNVHEENIGRMVSIPDISAADLLSSEP